MITGFNTDIKYEGITYHVQTEDKGLNTPLILSLIYQGGTILASKRSPYEDLISGGLDEKVLAERLNRQHKLLCAAIKAGRIEDLKRMTLKDSAGRRGTTAKKDVETIIKETTAVKSIIKETTAVKPKVDKPTAEIIPKPADLLLTDKRVRQQSYTSELQNLIQAAKSKSDLADVTKSLDNNPPDEKSTKSFAGFDTAIPIIEDVRIIEEPTIYDAVEEISEEEIILPPDAVEIVGDLSEFESLIGDELQIKFIGTDTFKSGENKTINLLVCRGSDKIAVSDANVMIKVLGASFRPLIFHSKTDNNGKVAVTLNIPTFKSGRAAILIRTLIKGEETEIRRVISPEV